MISCFEMIDFDRYHEKQVCAVSHSVWVIPVPTHRFTNLV